MLSSFAEIPAEISRRVRGGERVLLILLDAFGRQFLERHGAHPLVQRLEVTPLRSQFPSTTTAHVTTMHSGLPVEVHGLYEWTVLEPSLGAIICPLRMSYAGSAIRDELAARIDGPTLLGVPTFYETLGAPCHVFQDAELTGSAFTQLACRGASIHAIDGLADAIREARSLLAGVDGGGYAFVYWSQVDAAGHRFGPSSPEFEQASVAALDAVSAGCDAVDGELTVLITADHGQVDVAPDRVDYLDELWPELVPMLSHARPAGSSRDPFLHVADGQAETVIAELSERLGDRARVFAARELFGAIGPRLEERLGDVAILSAAGRQTWFRGASDNERWFRGQHGGLEPAETETYLAQLAR